uniref:Ig-like domain-containing protein n=1 Tax=Gopherus evgoodei TaxID=1825980 RepID=A0A8C4WSF8_9SAUR
LPLTASGKEIQILQSPAQVWLKSGDTAQLHCKTLEEVSAMWYKEQAGSLRWIYRSSEFALPDGKYSSAVNTATNSFSLIISNVQREDSGVYYCGLFSFIYVQPNFGNGTRLIITDASEPRLSILVPSTPEDAELPSVIPLLCLLSDFTPPWSAVLWDIGEEASEGLMDAGAIDGNGIFSVWSLMTIPSETWNQKTTCNCTAKENSPGRSISATVFKETGPVSPSILFLVQSSRQISLLTFTGDNVALIKQNPHQHGRMSSGMVVEA